MQLAELLPRLNNPIPYKGRQDDYFSFCPCHADGHKTGRRSLRTQQKDGKILLYCFAGCTPENIVKALGLTMSDLFTDDKPKASRRQIAAVYDYQDEAGRLMYEVVKYQPKDFRVRRPDGTGGWAWNLKGIDPLPYRLPSLKAALEAGKAVFIVEGEKDADNLAGLGLTATCNHGGAGKWREHHSKHFPAGAQVVILPDNDQPGRDHAEQVKAQLAARGCNVKVLNLPGLPDKGDVSDWIAAGGTRDQLIDLVIQGESGQEQPDGADTKKICYVQLSKVQPEEVSWLWKPYIPKRKITLLEGDPGIGKSWLSMALAAGITTGAAFPDAESGRPIFRQDPGNVIYLSAEDGPSDTLRPRFDSLGADVSRIYVVTGTRDEKGESAFSFDDLILLDSMAELYKPALIVIDPLQAYLGATVDMHRANETRPVLARLAALAERHDCAVLCIRHLNKGTGGKVLYRGMGSIDFTAAARSVLLAGCDQNDPSKRALIHIKSSLAPAGQAQGYELKDGFFWTGISTLTASELLSNEIQHSKEVNKLEEATTWLIEQLQNGPCEKKDLLELADDVGIKKMTLRRAAERLEVKSYKKPGEKNGPWLWELPGDNEQDDNNSLRVQMSNTSTREKTSNDAASTVCSLKNDDQDVEANNGAEYNDLTTCSNGTLRGKTRFDQGEQDEIGDAWEPEDEIPFMPDDEIPF